MKRHPSIVAAALGALVFAMPAQAAAPSAGEGAGPTVLDLARNTPGFRVLVAAVERAGLSEALEGPGPFTVFAPTDEAFLALPPTTLVELFRTRKKDLAVILQYHVLPAALDAQDVVASDVLDTLSGQRLDVAVEQSGRVFLDGSEIVITDLQASNGIVHVIDRVLLPNLETIVGTAQGAGIFDTLLAAVGAAGLTGALDGPGPLTVFAPTDEAFAALPPGTVETLLEPQNLPLLTEILQYHVVSGRVFADQALDAGGAPTLQGASVTVTQSGGQIFIDGARVVAPDVDARNGVVHAIDAVLMPPAGG